MFCSVPGMRRHSSKHTGESYGHKSTTSCKVCGKEFRCAADLEIHRVVHTREKPFKCQICDAAFTQKATLTGWRTILTECATINGSSTNLEYKRRKEEERLHCHYW